MEKNSVLNHSLTHSAYLICLEHKLITLENLKMRFHVVNDLYEISVPLVLFWATLYKIIQPLHVMLFNSFILKRILEKMLHSDNARKAISLKVQVVYPEFMWHLTGWPLSSECKIPRHFPDFSRHSYPCRTYPRPTPNQCTVILTLLLRSLYTFRIM